MMNIKNIFILTALVAFCNACQTKPEPQPLPPEPIIQTEKAKPTIKHPLGIIGAVEPIYILPIKSPFQARIDTGAETSSLDVDSFNYFERDGVKWVSFSITNTTSGETQTFEKRLVRRVAIRRINKNEKRPTVKLDIKFGGQIIKAEFTLAQREKFDYQTLIGRNIITGRALVDVSLSNTLR